MLTKNFKNIRYNWMLKDLKGNGRPRNHKKAEKNEEKKDE